MNDKEGLLARQGQSGGGGGGVATTTAHSNGEPSSASAVQANGKSSLSAPHVTLNATRDKDDEEPGSSAFEQIRDTLRISRPKKKKGKGKKLAYSIVVDPVQMSTPEITLQEPDKYQDPFETSYAENGEAEKKMDHIFKPASIPHNKPEYCDHCGDMAWGLYRQVLKCSSEFGGCCVYRYGELRHSVCCVL